MPIDDSNSYEHYKNASLQLSLRSFANMIRRYLLPCLLLIALFLPMGQAAHAQLSNYTFSVSSGGATDMSGASPIWTGATRTSFKNVVVSTPIGFNFNFDGTTYSQLSICTNGIIGLGTTNVTTSNFNQLISASATTPIIAPFWDFIRVPGGGNGSTKPRVSSLLSGGGTNQVLVIEFRDMDITGQGNTCFMSQGTWQVRLYQASGKIEFYYGDMNPCSASNADCYGATTCFNTSASIGLSKGSTNYISVTPGGGGATATYYPSSPNDNINLNGGATISKDVVYTFIPCAPVLTGFVGPNNGGTATMTNGDTFFQGLFTETGKSKTYRPFSAKMSDAACAGTLTLQISGPSAAEYYFGAPGVQTRNVNIGGGIIDTTAITFQPTGSGVRAATLTVSGPGGFLRTYNLGGSAPRINYIGNPPQGGTPGMANGDTLMSNIRVNRRGTGNFTPFSLINIGSAGPVNVTYTIIDPSGQYTINPPSSSMNTGDLVAPVITFAPTGVGYQNAVLVVNTVDEIRTFPLKAYSIAPGGQFLINNMALDTNSTLFINQFSCVGDGIISYPMVIRNTGDNDFIINDITVFETDTLIMQGTPRYPLRVDPLTGQFIEANDYIITAQPVVGSITANPRLTLPYVIPQGGSVTVYLTFVGSRPGKRFARAYITTNGENVTTKDPNGNPTLGLTSFDLFGRGVGGILTDDAKGNLPKPVVFPNTPIGQSSDKWFYLRNPGGCDLRIAESNLLRIFAGDVEEFSVVSVPSSWRRDGVTGDLLLPPGGRDSVQVRFTPRHIGSRRATLWMKTNDSTVIIRDQTERGSYYLDLYGEGTQGLYAANQDFGVVLLGGTVTSTRIAQLRNASDGPIIIQSVTIGGVDAADFTEDPANPWTVVPFAVMPGQTMDFGVVFNPTGTTAGPRSGMLIMVTDRGDSVIVQLAGEAGTRTIAVNPASVNFGNLTQGKASRRTVTIQNTGTMPLQLQAPVLGGTNPGDYTLGAFPRLLLAPGQSEFLEVTFMPAAKGPSSATLTIGSDAPGGAVVVQLGGTSVKTKFVGEDPSGTVAQQGDGGIVPGKEQGNVSSTESVTSYQGYTLFQSIPNPARDQATMGYSLQTSGTVILSLYDGAGRLVRTLENIDRTTGSYQVRIDVAGLAAGVYHVRMEVGGVSLSRPLTVIK
jgi:hypothetical protein